MEDIGSIPAHISTDSKEKLLYISDEIVSKIEFDHGYICSENMIINVHQWDYITTNMDNNPDKINLIKLIPNTNNYLLIAAIRINGFYVLTHFETKTSNDTNLKRLLGRGNVIDRVPSVCLHTNQGDEPTREGI